MLMLYLILYLISSYTSYKNVSNDLLTPSAVPENNFPLTDSQVASKKCLVKTDSKERSLSGLVNTDQHSQIPAKDMPNNLCI